MVCDEKRESAFFEDIDLSLHAIHEKEIHVQILTWCEFNTSLTDCIFYEVSC